MPDFGVPRPITPSVLFAGGRNFSYLTAQPTVTFFAWQAANRAVLQPFEITTAYLVEGFGWANAGTVSGNVDAGIYTLDGVRLMSTGSVAQTGTGTTQIAAITPTLLMPGTYYLALAMDNTTGIIASQTWNQSDAHMVGVCNVASAFPLPSTLTPTFAAAARTPSCAIFGRSMTAPGIVNRIGVSPVLVLNPMCAVSIGIESLSMGNNSAPGGAAWPAADSAVFVPFSLERPWTFRRTLHYNSGAASGNQDLGIYTRGGHRIVSTGSFAASGANAAQIGTIAETTLPPGAYYMAMACSNTSSKGAVAGMSIAEARMLGVMEMASAMPLPATATLTAATNAVIPMICFDQRS